MLDEAIVFLKSREKVNLSIVIINIIIFLILNLPGGLIDKYSLMNRMVMSARLVANHGEYYRLITSMFVHFGAEHIVYNMLLLIFAGDMLEAKVGKLRYLIIYLGGGILGNLLTMYTDLSSGNYHIAGGASGAIFAVIGALIWLALINIRQLGENYVRRLITIAVLSIMEGFTQPNVGNAAHIGGFVGGLILCIILNLFSH